MCKVTLLRLIVFAAAICLALVSVFLLRDFRSEHATTRKPYDNVNDYNSVTPTLAQIENALDAQEITVMKDASLRDEIARNINRHGLDFADSNGTKHYLYHDYDRKTPLVEIRLKMRDINGEIRPLVVRSLELDTHDSGGSYALNGTALRLEIWTDKHWEYVPLLYSREYAALAHFQGAYDAVDGVYGKTRTVTFKTPDALKPGEIYKVELVLVDRIWEANLLLDRAKEVARKKKIEEAEKITVEINRRPGDVSAGELIGIYNDGTRNREFGESNGKVFLMGPNKLGGELAVYLVSKSTGKSFLWAYVGEVTKRLVSLPQEADIVADEGDWFQIELLVKGKKKPLIDDLCGVAFFASGNRKVPLFGRKWERVTLGGEGLYYKTVRVDVIAGRYDVRGINRDGKEFILGQLDIGREYGKTYTLEVPQTLHES
jgi:hypothetical protein